LRLKSEDRISFQRLKGYVWQSCTTDIEIKRSESRGSILGK